MGETFSINKINQRYPDQWVLIGDPETDQSLEVLRGKVLYHGKSRDEMCQVAKDLPSPKHFATHHVDALTPDTTACCLNWGMPGGLGLSAEQWQRYFNERPAQTVVPHENVHKNSKG